MLLKKALSVVMLIFLGLTIPLLFLEAYLRLTAKTPVSFYQPDPKTGFWHIPGVSGYWTKPCFRTWVQFNSQGLRDVEHSTTKPKSTYRIVVLGDSFAEALQVPLESSFPKILERELQKRVGQTIKIEVINLGVSSFGTDQELLALRHYGLRYKPDLVLLAFLTGNDVRNNYYKLEEGVDAGQPVQKPYFLLDDAGRLVLMQPRKTPEAPPIQVQPPIISEAPLWKKIGRRFRIYHWIGDKIHRIREEKHQRSLFQVKTEGSPGQTVGQAQPDGGAAGHVLQVVVDADVYRPVYTADWDYAWRLTEVLIQEIAEESRRVGARFLLVSLTDSIQLLENRGEVIDSEKPIRLLTEIAKRYNIDYLPLLPVFKHTMKEKGYNLGDIHYLCDGHWTATGHLIAGRAIATFIYNKAFQHN